MIHFKLDTDTSFAQLTDGRLKQYGIETVVGGKDIFGRLTATISFEGSKILVRSDSQKDPEPADCRCSRCFSEPW